MGASREASAPRVTGSALILGSLRSSSTTFVATNRAAPKKSTWVRRKSEELNECHELGESVPIKIDECDNFADPQTKYLTTKVWLRHLHYTHNISGEPPPVAVKNKKKMVSIDE